MNTIRRHPSRRDERGSIAAIVAVSMVVLAAMGALAVDYSFLQYKRGQLQTAADSGALAGAAGLLSNGNNQSSVASTAVQYSQSNLGDQDVPTSAVTSADVTFSATSGSTDTVGVTVGRTSNRGNPVDMFLAPVLGWNTQDLTATAAASLFCSSSTKCLKPVSPPAKFTWTDTCTTSSKLSNNGQLDVDCPSEMASVVVQGYGESDLGTQITLKLSDSADTVVPGHYNAVDYPPVNQGSPITGAATYRVNWSSCTDSNNTSVSTGDEIQVEPGNMVGPTNQGLADVIDEDPNASWDDTTNSVVGSKYSDPMQSPRVALIPFYDPSRPQTSGRNTVYVYQLGAVFIESVSKKGEVTGRFMRAMAVSGTRDTSKTCDTSSVGLFGVGLVK